MTNREYLKKVWVWLICIAFLNVLIIATYILRIYTDTEHLLKNNLIIAVVPYLALTVLFFVLFFNIRKVPQNMVLMKIICIVQTLIPFAIEFAVDFFNVQSFFICYSSGKELLLFQIGNAITYFSLFVEMLLVFVLEFFMSHKLQKLAAVNPS